MPLYKLLFRTETCLRAGRDCIFEFEGIAVSFLFSKKSPQQNYVLTEVVVEAENLSAAHGIAAQDVIPKVLDALSFATSSSLLLGHRALAVKSQRGEARRRAYSVVSKEEPRAVDLLPLAVEETRTILGAGLSLPLMWQRHALRPGLIPERFVFQWLAFEGLAGTAEIPHQCTKCGEVYGSHQSSSKLRAREIYRNKHPQVSIQQFNKEVWGDKRNSVFHGSRYLTPVFLAELDKEIERLRMACRKVFTENYGLPERADVVFFDKKQLLYHTSFEWTTADIDAEFAQDVPTDILDALASGDGFEALNGERARAIDFQIMNSIDSNW